MQAERWKKVEQLYEKAIPLPPEKRAEFLADACPDDAELREEVRSLLAQDADSFLESAPVSAVKTLGAGAKLGNFEIVESIGRGGMGEVYRARDSRLKRDVAIKVLPAGLARDPDRIARFEREARAAGALNHPNIVSIYETGREGDTYWIASELVAGESLAKVMERGPMAMGKAVEIATQIAEGLAAAHAAAIVHRDLKPANIMVTGNGRVKILDFGLALRRRTSQDSTTLDLTGEGTVLGTAGYMSPEQVRGETVDQRSDLFSLGVILYEMLGGKRAFAGGSSVEAMHAILKEEPGELPPSVAPGLNQIVRRCLEKDRERRFQSASDLGFALRTLSAPQLPVQAAPKRWLKLAVLGLACFTAAAVGVPWLNQPAPAPRVTAITPFTPDGTSPPMLTDGTRLLFGLTGEPSQVSVKGGVPIALNLPMPDGDLVDISPDRSELLICRYRERVKGLERCELWAAPLVGGPAHRLGDLMAISGFGFVGDGSPDGSGFPRPKRFGRSTWSNGAGVSGHRSAVVWSPDGKQLIYPRENELHLARSDGTEIRKLSTINGYPFFVRWSPDGRTVRFSVSTPGDFSSSLWELSINDGRLRPLLPGWNPTWYTCCGNWTPDGKYYVFQSRSNIWAIREKTGIFRRGGSEPSQLTAGPIEAQWPLPSADGKHIFFGGYRSNRQFLRYDLKSGQYTGELQGISGTELEYSRDGKWLAYISKPDYSLIRAAADGSQRIQLTSPPMIASLPHWSPDGKQIAFTVYIAGKPSRIYLAPAEGGTLRPVTNGEGEGDPSWSPDGASLAFGGGSVQSIHVLDLKTNRVSDLPGSEGMWSPRWSPDGRFLAGLSAVGKLMLYDFQSHTQTQIAGSAGYPSWSGDGESLFFSADRWWWRWRRRGRTVERINVLNIVGGPEMFGLRIADWGWFAAGPRDSLLTVSDTSTMHIYSLEWDPR